MLLLWQLETGIQTTLPHLGAPLESLVVSPSGTRYAIRLADNSAMIISTSELSPIFNVPGVQLPSASKPASQLPYIPTVDTPTIDAIPPKRLRFPSVNGPKGLMCAVPSVTTSRIISGVPQNSSYLQTFDIGSAQQISRQAMTRTKITDLNIGPESNTIQEPDVRLIQISNDGKWLATVDEWMPPIRDLEPIAYDDMRASEEQNARKEIFLRFWSWEETAKTWELVLRIDKPHTQQAGRLYGSARILHLASDPSSNGFATIGEDGTVCIWNPSIRRRHGSAVRKKGDKDLMDWACHLAIPLDVGLSAWEILKSAKLAYSPDGSVLALGCYTSRLSTMHLIDTYDGTSTPNSLGPLDGPLLGLEFVDKYLITLSNHLRVWDLVSSKLHYGFTLDSDTFSHHERSNFAHLSTDNNRSTFAITLPTRNHSEKAGKRPPRLQSQLLIFDSKSPVPVFTRKFEKPTTQLLPLWQRSGYLVIDTAAEMQTVTPNVSSQTKMVLPTPPASEPETAAPLSTKAPKGIANLYGSTRPRSRSSSPEEEGKDSQRGKEEKTLTLSSAKEESTDFPFQDLEVEEDDAVVVPPEKLAEVFESPSAFALPPVMELFERVAELFGGKR